MLVIVNKYDIYSNSGCEVILSSEQLKHAIELTNYKMRELKYKTENDALNIFEVLDFRMMSGMLGEALVTMISQNSNSLTKNPHIDGYPDLLDTSSRIKAEYFNSIGNIGGGFNNFLYGGIEIKNTFGVKKAKVHLEKGQTRIRYINKKLDWKAHHTNTNNLLGLFSDFIEGIPQIVAVFYSDQLTNSDWKEKINPRKNSAMTSFSTIDNSGWLKMKSNLIVCINQVEYLSFFGD